MLFEVIDNNLFLTMLAYEYLINKRSITWLACNYDKNEQDIQKLLTKAKDTHVNGVLKPSYTYITDRTPERYVTALLNCEVDMDDGELGNPFPFEGAGLYYKLPIAHRQQFSRVCNRQLIDILYRNMSVTGVAAKYNISVKDVRRIAHNSGKLLFSGDLHKRVLFYREDMEDLAALNDFGTNTKKVFEFLFDSNDKLDDFIKANNLSSKGFKDDVTEVVHDCFCTMRNMNAVLALSKPCKHISGFVGPNQPFECKFIGDARSCLV